MANAGRVLSGAGTGAAIGTAFGPGVGTAIGAGVGGLVGLLSGGDDNGQQEAINKAIALYDSMGLPPDQSGPIIYKQLQAAGKLTPELEQTLKEELYNASTVNDNASTRSDLTSALQGIRSKAFGGLSPEQQANQQQLLEQVNANTQAHNKAILQGQAMQGKSGSGDTLAAMLSANQGGAQNASHNALQIGAQGQQAQDSALRDYLAGMSNLRAQDTSREQYNASAQNSANQFKAQNAASRQARNVASSNQANELNWNNKNQTDMYNTQVGNQELLRQKEAERQYWQDKMALAGGKANAYLGQASMLGQQAQNSNQNWNSALQGAGTIAGGIAQNNAYNKRTEAMYPAANRSPASDQPQTYDYEDPMIPKKNQFNPYGNP